MTRYRARAVLLLFGVLYLTACSSWQSIGPVSPSRFIEAEQPDRVRVTGGRVFDLELVSPSVEGDQLVGANGVSLPLADVLMLETREFNYGKTIGLGALVLFLGPVLIVVGVCAFDPSDCGW